ncbi:hypothetical protein DTG28_24565 [Salmonella enterica subsp. salamae]|nr:hypothetical protein [Salmonella enterica subsp. salamae]
MGPTLAIGETKQLTIRPVHTFIGANWIRLDSSDDDKVSSRWRSGADHVITGTITGKLPGTYVIRLVVNMDFK